MKKFLPFGLVLLFSAIPSPAMPELSPESHMGATSATDADLATVRERYVRSVLPVGEAAVSQVEEAARKYAATLRDDGSWADIRYDDVTPRLVWASSVHLNRLLVMAKAARIARDEGHADEVLEARVLLALQWWTAHDYRHPTWWWNLIGVPELTGEIGSVMGAQLPDDQRAKIIAILKRSDWRQPFTVASLPGTPSFALAPTPGTVQLRRVPWMGANLIWGVGIEIARGCLENDPAPVEDGYKRMYEEIRIVSQPDEGIEQDYSFHQHGVQLYNGGYGLDFANLVGRFVSYSWGTHFQIPVDRMSLFSAFLLDGQQWMIRGNTFDYTAVGREITRRDELVVPKDQTAGPVSPMGPPYSLGNVISMLASEPTPRQMELAAFADRLNGKVGAAELTGNKQFWCSDFMTHRRAGYYTSVKMLSSRMLNSELINSEGKKSVHMSDGANFLYVTGDEYRNIFPVWDWTKIPGTTAIQGTLETGEQNAIGTLGTTTFDGGVTDGRYGMAAMDLARGNLIAKKAWFFFDSSYVALGAGITLNGDMKHGVVTDVNQPLLRGDVLSSETAGPVSGNQNYDPAKSAWFYHDRVGYIFAPHTQVKLSAGTQSGAWSEIGNGSSTPVTEQVFDLWIDHGTGPQNASYEYIVAPNATVAEVAKLAAHPDVELLSNTAKNQAVYNKPLKLAEIAFRNAGELETPLGKIEVDHSCLLLVRRFADGWKVTASNPENQALALHVAVHGKRATIELPGGNDAGSSVTVDVKE
ncbi:MAG TPA: polysaccharide lyase family 8 super-sandwich domain-containing protein [Terracidiphilus sp.]|nr:polysaccharide lyase family 8 super-sandwich domain-containing protein [Terracidiphilus sp.]